MSHETCARIRDRFSDLFEEAVDAKEARHLRAHLDGCAACAEEWSSFVRAVGVLREHHPGATPTRYVEQILAAVDGEARHLAAEPSDAEHLQDVFQRAMSGQERAPRRRTLALTHVAAVVLGAAAAVVVLPWLGVGGAEPQVVERVKTVHVPQQMPLKLDLVSGHGRLVRDGRPVELGETRAIEPRPGDVLEVEHGDGLSLLLGADGMVRIEAHPARVQPPTIIERQVPVERIKYVPTGPLVQVDGEAFDHALVRIEGMVQTVGTQMKGFLDAQGAPRVVTETAPTVTEGLPRDVHEVEDVVEVTRGVTPPTPPPAVSVAAAAPTPPPVLVRRTGNRVRIETFGAPHEIIPDLIALLDGGDADVGQAARLRLEEIRSTLTTDPDLARRLVDTNAAPDEGGTLAFVKGLFAEEAPPPPRTETESWQVWWEKNAIHILEAGTWGTF